MGEPADTQDGSDAEATVEQPLFNGLPRTIDGVDRKLEELRQSLPLLIARESKGDCWAKIDVLLERRLLLEEAHREGVPTV